MLSPSDSDQARLTGRRSHGCVRLQRPTGLRWNPGGCRLGRRVTTQAGASIKALRPADRPISQHPVQYEDCLPLRGWYNVPQVVALACGQIRCHE